MAAETCAHCWHPWGVASGGISQTGSHAAGVHRCCFCGMTENYDYRFEIPAPPAHGPYYAEILRYPA